MPQPPPLRRKRPEHLLDLVLGASAYPAALGERQPVAGVEPESERKREQATRSQDRSQARDSLIPAALATPAAAARDRRR